jgi:hypothetical protein
MPGDPPKSFKYNNQNHVLTAEEWDKYKTVRGQTAYELLKSIIASTDYKNADESTQVKMIKNAWDYAEKVGKKAVAPDYLIDDDGSVESITQGSKIDSYKTKMMRSLESGDFTGYQAMAQALRDEGMEDTDIRKKINDKYSKEYKNAYRRNDTSRMQEIIDILDMTEYEFDIDKWEEDVDEKYGNTGSLPKPIGTIASTGGLPSRGSDTTGRYGLGNIDLNNRQVVDNGDGTISTEVSMSFYDEDTGKEILIPTVINGRIVSEDEAIDHYYETGEYLGMFDTPQEADEYAEKLHNRQNWYYNR